MSSSKRTNVPPKEWAKHLRPFGKKEFWSSVRNLFRSEEKEEMILEIDPEELKRNKEKYERELRASLNGEEIVYEDNGHLIEQPRQLPIAVTHPIHLSKEDQIKANAETVDVFFPDKEDKPHPKIVTIEVSGLVGTGKIALLQLIDNIIQEKLSVVPLCAELEDKNNLININDIPQIIKDSFKEGKILIEMRMIDVTFQPNKILECPCPGCGE